MLPVARQGEAVAFDELFRTPHGLDLGRVADLFGLAGQQVRDPVDLESAIERARAHPGVSIIHVPVESRSNEAHFRAALAEAQAAVEDRAPEARG
jgi:2-succinyl-5-enolpyruvyl-6-hydroxy-3-cyclohexene-1-carboxylate synthase